MIIVGQREREMGEMGDLSSNKRKANIVIRDYSDQTYIQLDPDCSVVMGYSGVDLEMRMLTDLSSVLSL